MQTRMLSVGLVVSLFAVGIVTPASAKNKKTYSGAFCEVGPGTGAVRGNGAVVNDDSNEPESLKCPFVRDDAGSSDYPPENVEVHVDDNNPNSEENVCCTFRVFRQNRDAVKTSEKCTTGNPGFDQFSWSSFPSDSSTFGGDSAYVLQCDVPAKYNGETSGVFGYTIEE